METSSLPKTNIDLLTRDKDSYWRPEPEEKLDSLPSGKTWLFQDETLVRWMDKVHTTPNDFFLLTSITSTEMEPNSVFVRATKETITWEMKILAWKLALAWEDERPVFGIPSWKHNASKAVYIYPSPPYGWDLFPLNHLNLEQRLDLLTKGIVDGSREGTSP